MFNDNQHVAAVHTNGNLVGAASLSVPGYTFAPAQPGEIISIYANGFGPTSVPVVSGSLMQGEFQFNVVIPANAPGADQSITATYNGATTQAGTLITIAGGR